MSSVHGTRRASRTISAPVGLRHAGRTREELLAEFQRVLARRIHGLCFSAYLDGQGPGRDTLLGEEQIRARLEIIRPATSWIRTFSCTDGNEHAPRIARGLGLKTLAGAWLGRDRARNQQEISRLVEIGRAGDAGMVAVGNEVLLREDLPEAELLDCIRRVKQALPGIPVGYVDAYYLFCEHPALVDACDVLFVNCYPFWEECSLERAPGYMREMIRRVRAAAGGKPIAVTETGWPSAGSPVGEAVPSFENAILYALNAISLAEEEQVPLFYFSSFDEEWKQAAEGDCGTSWGFWDSQGNPKYGGSHA